VIQTDHSSLEQLLRHSRVESSGGLARTLGARLVQARLGLAAAPQVGRYVIERKLGEGGMGTVFLGRDPELDRPLAVKVLNPRDDALAQSRLALEARALARLNHENVLIVHDVGAEGDQLWIAMEYVHGGTLREWRQANLDASWAEVTRRALHAARGLAAAHQAGIVHRDFKPDNVMVGTDGRVRVTDFGLALLDGSSHAPSGPGPSGEEPGGVPIEGTPVYLPPEVAEGQAPSPLGDQYSFFVTLRELLDAPGEAADANPAALDAVILRGTRRDPTARWESMNEVVERLTAVLGAPQVDPHREALMRRVDHIWRDGAHRAHGEVVPLDLEPVDGAVEPPWGAAAARSTSSRTSTTADLRLELWRAQGSLLLLGGPGSGKTIALVGLLGRLLERAREDPHAPIPVILNVASFGGSSASLMAWLVDELVTKYGLPRKRAGLWLEEDALVLLLDGLDEVVADRRRGVVSRINAFRREHPASMVVACRDAICEAIDLKLQLGAALRIEPPSDRALELMCAAHGVDPTGVPQTLAGSHRAPRPSPLVLSVWLRSGEGGGAGPEAGVERTGEGAVLPERSLYDAFVERALERAPPLSPRARGRLLTGLTWVAQTLRRVGTADLWLERLQFGWLPTAGQRLAAMTLGVLGLCGVALAGHFAINQLADRPPVVMAVLAGFTVLTAVLLNRGLQIRPREALRWSWRAALRRVPLMVGLGVGAGLVLGIFFIAWVNVVLCVAAGLALAVALGLEPRDHASRLRPAQGLRQSLRTAVLVGLGAGLLTGVAVGYVAVSLVLPHVGPESRLHLMDDPRLTLFTSAAGFAALLTGLAYGGTAVIFHGALRVVIALRSPLPFWLATWLDRAADRGLIRRIGGGWIFLHDTLLEHFRQRGAEADGPDVPAHDDEATTVGSAP